MSSDKYNNSNNSSSDDSNKSSDSVHSTKSIKSKKSISSLTTKKQKKYDSIPFRLDFIKELLVDKKVKSMIDLCGEHACPDLSSVNNDHHHESGTKCKDVRCILKKKRHNFHNIIEQMNARLVYIKSGTTGHTFKGISNGSEDNNENFNFAVKVVGYPRKEKYGDLYDIRRPENAEIYMIKILSEFVIKKQTPHIVLPIVTFNTSIKPFIEPYKNKTIKDKKYKKFVKRYKKGEFHSHVSILISEWANSGDLLDFIRNNHMSFKTIHWKILFFQLISTLAVIQSKYPKFRHNDLKANNVLVHKINSSLKNKYKYTVHGSQYLIPNIGFQIKLWDFDFASIPGLVDNAKVNLRWTNDINVKPKKNRYYDMHYFFNTLTRRGFFPEFFTSDCIDQEVKDFVRRVVPKKYAKGRNVAERGRILINDEYITPDQVLKTDPFFEDLKISDDNKK
jgi:hypothetical protein